MKPPSTTKRLAGALAVGALVTLSLGTAALAGPQDFGNIDGSRVGSLTVHKFLHQSGAHEGDISQAPDSPDFTNPVPGVVFTVYPVLDQATDDPVDLADPAAWDGLGELSPGAACTAPEGYSLGAGIAMPATDDDGIATLDLSVGLYQVCETSAPAHIVDKALPFLLTVPMAHENGWVYDVHAYPKNGAVEIEKTIEPQADQGLGIGAPIHFPTSVVIPTMQDVWTGFAIRDTLDSRLTPATDAPYSHAVASVTLDGVDLDSTFYTLLLDGQTSTVEFTALGIAWLNEKTHAGKEITVTFAGIINDDLGNGTIPNTAELWTNNPDYDSEVNPPVPSNTVESNWGSLEVLKRAAGTTGDEGLLDGAVFEVYNTLDPYASSCTGAEATGDPLSVGGSTEFTSIDGVISVPGLFVSDSENPAINAESRCYVLKEIAAPAGYILPTGDDALIPVSVGIGTTTTAENAEIVNTQQDVPELPLTGASGQLLLLTVGGIAILAGLTIVVVRRKQTSGLK